MPTTRGVHCRNASSTRSLAYHAHGCTCAGLCTLFPPGPGPLCALAHCAHGVALRLRIPPSVYELWCMVVPYSVRAAHYELATSPFWVDGLCFRRLAYFLPKGRTSPRVSFGRCLGSSSVPMRADHPSPDKLSTAFVRATSP